MCPCATASALAANVFHPAGAHQPLPVVLIRQPYGKDDHPFMHARGTYWARKGYVCVVQDVRGKYGSGGVWEPVVNEAADGWDTLDWVAARPWCCGDIGMVGESYYGMTQWAVAGSGHPHLRCLAPGDTAPDLYRAAYPGGAFSLMVMGEWAYEMNARRLRNPFRFDPWHLPVADADEAAGAVSPAFKDFTGHPRRDDFWERRDLSRGGVAVPALHWSGWYDVMLDGTLDGWQAATTRPGGRRRGATARDRADRPRPDSAHQRPGGTLRGRTRLLVVRPGRALLRALAARLEQRRRSRPARAGVRRREHIAGAPPMPGRCRAASPRASTCTAEEGRRRPAGACSAATTPADEACDSFSYDPDDPLAYWLSRSLWDVASELDDRRPVEARPDVLVYSTAPLATDLEVAGPLSATLYVSSSAPATDFTAALVDVFPDGYAQLVQEGIARVPALNGDGAPSGGDASRDDDGAFEIDVDLCAAGHLFAAGHRVRLEVSSSNFGRYDRNLNTGGTPAADALGVVARQTVYHDRRRPSHLTLPVIPAESCDS